MTKRRKNPAELLLMGANPMKRKPVANSSELLLMGANPAKRRNPYNSLSRDEKLAFGRLGLGKAQLRTQADIDRARQKVADVTRFKNAMPGAQPNPTDNSQQAQQLYESFTETESTQYISVDAAQEPHIPAGDYALLGKLISLRVKPERGGQVQEITFPGKNIKVISTAAGDRIFFCGPGQELDESEVKIFTSSTGNLAELGVCRSIVYLAAKWHQAVPASVRGEKVEWEHQFGEDGGYPPALYYERAKRRLILGVASYHVEGAGIVN